MDNLLDRLANSSFTSDDSPFYHIPPTAVPFSIHDLNEAVVALIDPPGSIRKFHLAMGYATSNTNCFLMTSGRAALVIILLTLKRVSSRSKVILPAYTCPTVAQAILRAGLKPVFCDVNIHTLDMEREFLHELLDEEVLAIIPTHLYGLAHDISDLLEIGRELQISIIEDAAQAFGARYAGHMVGNSGDFGFFSLGRGKCIPSGHGGVIITRDCYAPELGKTLQETITGKTRRDPSSIIRFIGNALATTPFGWWFISHSPFNPADLGMDIDLLPQINIEHLSSTQAGIASSLLARMDQIISIHRDNARKLLTLLSDYEYVNTPSLVPGSEPVYLRLPIILEQKSLADRLFSLLSRSGIGVSRSYFRTLPDIFSCYHKSEPMDFPGADHLAKCLLTLPTNHHLQDVDIGRIKKVLDVIEA